MLNVKPLLLMCDLMLLPFDGDGPLNLSRSIHPRSYSIPFNVISSILFFNGPFHIYFFPKLPFHATTIGLHFDVTLLFPPYTQFSSSGSLHVDSTNH
jgi:hypothetical protein